ncbi:MAG TPA: hypothetical protein VK955_11190, partial [Xanthobacteraceae bacterium]|nr:hypothetical protein [Xanthobacteraceae bacterium]
MREFIKPERRNTMRLLPTTLLALSMSSLTWAGIEPAHADKASSAPKNGFVTIDHMAMTPDGDTQKYFNKWSDGLLAVENACFNTAVNLPDGATVVDMTVYVKSGPNTDPDVYLQRHKLSDGFTENVAFDTIKSDSGRRKAGSILPYAPAAIID